jgi:hypothetical protein
MKEKYRVLGSLCMVTFVLFVTLCLIFTKEVVAKQEIVAIEGMSYNVDASMTDNLKSLLGKKVSLTTVSGKTFSGVVKEVGNHLIHLEKLEGKEFYDGLIVIEDISAIEAMFRNYQR